MCLCGLGSLACCVTSTACSLCCACCPKCKNSTSARIVYAIFLILGVVTCIILLTPQIQDAMKKTPIICKGLAENNIVIHDQPGYNDPLLNCQLVVGYRSVYAVCFGMVMFFAFMALLMVCVKSSRDPRAGIQNGFWLFKFLAFIGAIVGGFFILQLELFPTVWMYFGLIGGFLFILIQLLLLVDFAFAWNEKFLERFEETQHKGWYAGLLVFTILFYLVILAAVILFYLFYANGDCSLHKFFVSFNLILVVIMSIVAVLPKIQEKNPRSGLLQPALIGAYIMYLTWGAMSSNPDKTCNPTLLEIFIDVNQTATYGTTSSITAANSIRQQLDGVSILTLLIFMVAVLYASIRNSSHSSVGKLTLSGGRNHERVVLGEEAGSSIEKKKGNDEDESRVYDNESDGVAYNYSFLHVMLALASFYIMMTLTNWYKPNLHNGVFTLQTSEPAMWVKISSSWVCVLFFLWTLIAPVALPNRDFN